MRNVIARPVLVHMATREIILFWKSCKNFLSRETHENSRQNPYCIGPQPAALRNTKVAIG
jgi:hypothetical protein